jgi:hypothetical protein
MIGTGWLEGRKKSQKHEVDDMRDPHQSNPTVTILLPGPAQPLKELDRGLSQPEARPVLRVAGGPNRTQRSVPATGGPELRPGWPGDGHGVCRRRARARVSESKSQNHDDCRGRNRD